jgi:Zn-dependent protease
MSWRDRDEWDEDDPMRRLGRPGGDWRGLRPSLDNPMTWAVPVGRAVGINVRVHVIFLIFIVIELLRAAVPRGPASEAPPGIGLAALLMGLLFAIVLLHEFGHCLACRRTGGAADEILMWPLGGLAYCLPPNHWRAHLITAAGGPAVNVVIALLVTPALGLATGRWWGVAIPNPFAFSGLYVDEISRSWVLTGLYLAGQLNLILLLFNLLPMFPLDGGRIAQAVLWPKLGYARSMRIAVRVGYVGAICLGIFGIVREHWMLVGIAAFGGITCYITHRQLRFTEQAMGFEPGEPPAAERRAQQRAERQARRDQEDQSRLDAILRKISRSGMKSLTLAEKRRLRRATHRKQSQ